MPAGAATPELLVTVALAAMLRLYRLADESLWLDEAYSVGIVRRHSYRWLLFEHPTFDPHPPLHYVLLKPWIAFFGASEMAVRLQAVLFGVGTVVVTYWLGRDLFGRQAGAIGALLVAVAPVHLWQSQTVRMYTLLAFMTGLSYLALVRLTREVTRRRAAVYILATALLGYTHVFGLFVILAQSVYLLTRPLLPGQELAMDLRRWVPLQGLVAVLLSP
jgi:mannosyltransferase